jgi:small subunit ribosomal protein S16
MATRIRLHRVGRKKQPVYRIVVTDKQKARDGRSVETLGHYDPRSEPVSLDVDVEKARAWLAQGATPSETVRSLLKKAGVFETPAES